jgi:hypothetical protein
MKQSALYCVGAYAANVIPRDFINFSEFPLQGDNIALVSDPFSGADVRLQFDVFVCDVLVCTPVK